MNTYAVRDAAGYKYFVEASGGEEAKKEVCKLRKVRQTDHSAGVRTMKARKVNAAV